MGEPSERTPLVPDGDLLQNADDGSDVELEAVNSDNATQSNKSLGLTTGCILFTELGERMTFYSVTANQVPFCKSVLGYNNAAALSINQAFIGACYLLPVVSGWVADSVAGRYNTIYGASLVYVVGVILLPIIGHVFGPNHPFDRAAKRGFFFIALAFIAVGTGGIKSNVGPFGARQVEEKGPEVVNSFFNWFYWFINMGSLVSFTGIAYVQQRFGFDYGYAIPAAVMFLSIIVFVIPRKKYIGTGTQSESMVANLLSIVCESVRKKWRSTEQKASVFDFARASEGGRHSDDMVDQVAAVIRTLPVLTCFIIYWLVNQQSAGQYILQAMGLNLSLGTFTLPAASLNIFNAITIMILVPFVERLIYPWLKKINRDPTLLQRIGFGMILTVLALIASILLEVVRKDDIRHNGGFAQNVTGQTYNASSISVLWQTPQFCLLGAGEVFTSISGLQFSYSETPRCMQGLMMGVFLLTIGVGSFLGSALVSIVNHATQPHVWIPDDINTGHVEYYYLLTSGLLLVNFLVFLLIARKYEYKRLGLTDENAHGDDER